jgi:hypothetical protein
MNLFILLTFFMESTLLEYFKLLSSLFIDGSVSSEMERALIMLLIIRV